MCESHEIAEELTQETFYKAIRSARTFKGECKVSTWLCEIAKNTWKDYLKKEKQEESNKKSSNEEIDYLKKYNLRMNLLKYFMLALAIFIIVRYLKGQRIDNILQTAYSKVTRLEYTEDNFLYEANRTDLAGNQISNRKYYYKDGKYKEVEVRGEDSETRYGIGPYRVTLSTRINKDGINEMSGYSQGSIGAYPYNTGEMGYLRVWSELSIIESSKLGIRDEMYNGKECYVIYDGKTWEVWIDKEDMSVVMQKSDIGINTFNLTHDIVSDEDVELPQDLQTRDLSLNTLKPEEIEQFDERIIKSFERAEKMQKDTIESYKMLDNAMIKYREDSKVD